MAEHPRVPDYGGPCLSNVVPALLGNVTDAPDWIPEPARDAEQIVLLALDGLGWDQLQPRRHLTPNLDAMVGRSITTVAPTTTATALTSLATGTTPGEHGVLGYRIAVDGAVLNILRWTTPGGDARRTIAPESIQTVTPFVGQFPPVVTRAEFMSSGFTEAHLSSTRLTPYRMLSSLITEVRRLTAAGEPFVYAYYEGIDKVAHEYGLNEFYDAELEAVDRLIGELLEAMPSDAVLVVTSDHGQVDVGDRLLRPHRDILDHVRLQSGEGRFRWLHAEPGRVDQLLEAAQHHFDHVAWVRTAEEVIDAGWFGPEVDPRLHPRLGDVALVAREPVAFDDPTDTGPFSLIGRHGSMTAAEIDVPLLATTV